MALHQLFSILLHLYRSITRRSARLSPHWNCFNLAGPVTERQLNPCQAQRLYLWRGPTQLRGLPLSPNSQAAGRAGGSGSPFRQREDRPVTVTRATPACETYKPSIREVIPGQRVYGANSPPCIRGPPYPPWAAMGRVEPTPAACKWERGPSRAAPSRR